MNTAPGKSSLRNQICEISPDYNTLAGKKFFLSRFYGIRDKLHHLSSILFVAGKMLSFWTGSKILSSDKDQRFNSYSFLFSIFRCMWNHRHESHRKYTRKVTMRSRRVLPEPVPKPAHKIRKAPASASFPADCQRICHRTAFLRSTCR